jgi:hypothetical protein
VIHVLWEPARTWLKADPVAGEVSVDEERSVGIKRSPENDPRANAQYWACKERLEHVKAAGGDNAYNDEFHRMRNGELPPIQQHHIAEANSFRRCYGVSLLPAI